MDLGWSQAQWTDFFKFIGSIASSWYYAKRIDEESASGRITADKHLDASEIVRQLNLEGLVIGDNTDVSGILWCDISVGAGTLTMTLYSASSKAPGTEVAQGSIATASLPGYVTLAEQNNSGLTGTAYISIGLSDSDIFFVCTPAISSQVSNLPVEDEVDTAYKDRFLQRFKYISGSALVSRVESIARTELINYIRAKIKSNQDSAGGGREVPGEGAIDFEYYGVVGDLIDAMNDETVAGQQTVQSRSAHYDEVVAPVADVGNVGKGSLATGYFEHFISGTYTVECISATLGSEQFSVSVVDRSGKKFSSENYLQVRQTFNSLDLGLNDLLLSRTIEDSDSGSGIAARLSDWAFQGESSNNTDSGKLYGKYIDSTKTLYLYSDSSLADRYEVASGVWDGTPGSTVVLAESRGSGLTGTVKVNSDPAADVSDLEVNLNVFAVGDKFYFEVEKVGYTWWNEFFGQIFKANLPSSEGAYTIAVEIAHRGFSGLSDINYETMRR
jgi:hypothetical protein